MLNSEQRKQLAQLLAKRLREDEADYINPRWKDEERWTDQLERDLQSWITEFNNEI